MFNQRWIRKNLYVGALALALAAPSAWAQNGETISVPLSDPAKPAWVKVGLVMGSITVEAYEGKEVLVETTTDMEEVETKAESRRDGLRLIPNTSRGMTVEEQNNQVEISVESWNKAVSLKLRVPRKTSLKLSTVNDGSIEVRGVEGDLELGNTNGPITALDVAGSVVAQTINGDLKVVFRAVTPDKPMSFTNMNGDVDVTLPSSVKADFRMRSDMGDILTDFDVDTVSSTRKSSEGGEGRGFRLKIEKEVRAQVNGGGPELVFKNFNGDILIRKGK